MKSGDLVFIELPDRVADVYPYKSWHNCYAVIIKESTSLSVFPGWTVLVNNTVREISTSCLRKIDETR